MNADYQFDSTIVLTLANVKTELPRNEADETEFSAIFLKKWMYKQNEVEYEMGIKFVRD